MDTGAIRKFMARRSARATGLGVAVCVLLAVPIAWMAQQSRTAREALERASAAEQAAAQARADLEQARGPARPPRDPAVRRSRHDDPREIERVKQLYAEVESLSEMQQRIDDTLGQEPRIRLRKPPALPLPARKP
ncbi:MAG TPA: hypothetical protein VKW77_10845 [Acidimicrobiales bacterium]|nr:hypothetical protein [Acidimicrobiales bacterium]